MLGEAWTLACWTGQRPAAAAAASPLGSQVLASGHSSVGLWDSSSAIQPGSPEHSPRQAFTYLDAFPVHKENKMCLEWPHRQRKKEPLIQGPVCTPHQEHGDLGELKTWAEQERGCHTEPPELRHAASAPRYCVLPEKKEEERSQACSGIPAQTAQ